MSYQLYRVVPKRTNLAMVIVVIGLFLIWHCSCVLSWGQAGVGESETPKQKFLQFLEQGSRALEQGDNALAEKNFREAHRLDPRSVEILNNLAISLARQNREAEAIAFYEQALKVRPGDPITLRNLGVAYFRAHRYKDARPLLQSFAEATPTFQALDLTGVDLFALDEYAAAAAYLERASRLQPNDLPTLDLLGKAYWRAKDYAGVTQVFERIMAINPGSAEAHFMLGLAYDLKFEEEEARQEFQAAVAADPNYPGLHSSLGLIDWRQHKVTEAATEFKQELARYPDDPISNYMMGQILRQQSQPSAAIPYLQAAIAANPNYKDALLELGQCNIQLKQPKEALPPLKKATEVDPSFAQAHFVLGTAFSMLGDTAAASRERRICGELEAKQHAQLIHDLAPAH
jgi:Flp pilus assembly protein TadD